MSVVKGLANINALLDKPRYDENKPKSTAGLSLPMDRQ